MAPDLGAEPMLLLLDEHTLDIARRELTRGVTPVAVTPQVFDLLVYLIRNRDRVVGKDELIQAVWNGRIVSDSALTTRINAVRDALGDTGAARRYIRTIHRKGVRFVGNVQEIPAEPGLARAPQSAALQPAPLVLPDKPSIAVLPFQNLSGDPALEYFADGMVEEIITALSRIRWLFVIARNSSFTYKGQAIDVKRVGCELGVRYLLEGSVRAAGGRVCITAQLIDAADGAHLWADRFDGSLEAVFDLHDQVATTVAGIIEPTLQAAEIRRTCKRPTNDLSAYDLYLRALPHIATYRWDDTIRALALLRQAIERDPGFASALARGAYCHAVLDAIGQVEDRPGNRRTGLDLARRALLVGGDDAVALAFTAHTLGYFNEDIDAAIAIVDRATAFNPSGAYGWRFSGFQRLYAGQCELAVEHFERSIRLSPREARWPQLTGIAMARFFRGRLEDAAATLSQALQENPTYPLANRALISCFAHMGRLDEACAVMTRLRAVTPMLIPDEINYRNPEHRELFLSGLRLVAGETT
jgi:TolB-like protein/Flp pilus assembly protein TadD